MKKVTNFFFALIIVSLSTFSLTAMEPESQPSQCNEPMQCDEQFFQLICSDGVEIYMQRSVLEQSKTLREMIADTGQATHTDNPIPISLEALPAATGQVMDIIHICMMTFKNRLPRGIKKASSNKTQKVIRELIDVLAYNLFNMTINAIQARTMVLQAFNIARWLDLPLVSHAIACMLIVYNKELAESQSFSLSNFMPNFITNYFTLDRPKDVDDDLWNTMQQAKHFLDDDNHESSNLKSNWANTKIVTINDLVLWGLAPNIPVAENIIMIDDYVRHLVQTKEFLALQEMFTLLDKHHYESLSQQLQQAPISCIRKMVSNHIDNQEFTELQDMLESLVTHHLVQIAKQAYKALVDHVRTMSLVQIQELFRNPALTKSALQKALLLVSAQRDRVDLNEQLPCFDFINSPKVVAAVGPGETIIMIFETSFIEIRFCLSENVATLKMLKQSELKYILPLLEPIFDKVVVEVNFNNWGLNSLPAEICLLADLGKLNLYNNQLSDLPAEFGLLKQLSWLSLSRNQFVKIPGAILHLKNLNTLLIAENQISGLPDELAQLNLKNLYIDSEVKIPSTVASRWNFSIKQWNPELHRYPLF